MGQSRISPVSDRANLAAQIHDVLRAALISGELAPDTVYSIPTLARRFAVSATPVREAMLALVREGLVAPVPNKGFRVLVIDDATLDQVMQVRRLLEIPAIIEVARAASPRDLQRFRRLARRIVAHAEVGDVLGYLEADRQLHLDMLRTGGNATLVELVDQLRARTRLLGLSGLADRGLLRHSAAEHMDLIDAIEARDEERIRAAMEHHLGHVRGIWSGRPEEGPPQR